VFRGKWDLIPNPKKFYNNAARRDVVKFNEVYWIFKGVDGSTQNSFNDDVWDTFGSQFSSVATELLLAETANIGGWVIRNERLESQSGGAFLNGADGTIQLGGGNFSVDENGNVSIVGLFESGSDGDRIIISPTDKSLKMYNAGNRLTASLSFITAANNMSISYLTLYMYDSSGNLIGSLNLSPGSISLYGIDMNKAAIQMAASSYGSNSAILSFDVDKLPSSPTAIQRGMIYRDGTSLRIKTDI
jgi:hypothetical protein